MKIEDQICTLEQANKLLRLKINFDFHVEYYFVKQSDGWTPCHRSELKDLIYDAIIPAYTVAELGVLLPGIIDRKGCEPYLLRIRKQTCPAHYQYNSGYLTFDELENLINRTSLKLAWSMADVLIWLLEDGNIKPEDLKL